MLFLQIGAIPEKVGFIGAFIVIVMDKGFAHSLVAGVKV